MTHKTAVALALSEFSRVWRPVGDVDADTLRIWSKALQGFDADRIVLGVENIVRSRKAGYFPTPAELIEAIPGPKADDYFHGNHDYDAKPIEHDPGRRDEQAYYLGIVYGSPEYHALSGGGRLAWDTWHAWDRDRKLRLARLMDEAEQER